MASTPAPRIQLVVSGKFIALLLLAVSLLGVGYYWRSQQQQSQQHNDQEQARFKPPPYFVSQGATVIRNCHQCLDAQGNLKPRARWKVSGPQEIPAGEQHWFLAVEDPPLPVTVAGVLMLPLHPAVQEDPSFGFDQSRVVLVIYQNLQRMSRIEKPQLPPPAVPDLPKPSPSPVELPPTGADRGSPPPETSALTLPESPYAGAWKNIDPNTQSLTRLLVQRADDALVVHAWASCSPVECDWGESRVPLAPVADGLHIVWDHHFALDRQEIALEGDGRLKVSLTTQFKDNSGRRDYEIVSYFRKASTP